MEPRILREEKDLDGMWVTLENYETRSAPDWVSSLTHSYTHRLWGHCDSPTPWEKRAKIWRKKLRFFWKMMKEFRVTRLNEECLSVFSFINPKTYTTRFHQPKQSHVLLNCYNFHYMRKKSPFSIPCRHWEIPFFPTQNLRYVILSAFLPILVKSIFPSHGPSSKHNFLEPPSINNLFIGRYSSKICSKYFNWQGSDHCEDWLLPSLILTVVYSLENQSPSTYTDSMKFY